MELTKGVSYLCDHAMLCRATLRCVKQAVRKMKQRPYLFIIVQPLILQEHAVLLRHIAFTGFDGTMAGTLTDLNSLLHDSC